MSILDATHRAAPGSIVAGHDGIDAVEVKEAGVGAIYRTAPIVAVVTNSVERTIAEAAAASHGQFQR